MICPTSTDTAGAKESPLILKDDFLDIGPNALEAVIVGCQTSDDVIHAVRSLIKEHSSNVKVRRAVRASNKYTLQLEDI